MSTLLTSNLENSIYRFQYTRINKDDTFRSLTIKINLPLKLNESEKNESIHRVFHKGRLQMQIK